MAINVKDKLVTVESLGIAYSTEQGARQEADQALSTRIDNIVAPDGDPSLTEVSDARVSGSTTHNTLKARLDADQAAVGTEIAELKADLGSYDDALFDKTSVTPTYSITFNSRYDPETGRITTAASGKYCRTGVMTVRGHSRVIISGKEGYNIRPFYFTSSDNADYDDCESTGKSFNIDLSEHEYIALVISREDSGVIDTTLTSADFFEITYLDSRIDAFTDEIGTELTEVKNNLVALESGYRQTSSTVTGWLKGYYSGNVGETVTIQSTSNNYIRLHNAITPSNYPMLASGKYIEVEPPYPYAVRIMELDEDNVITNIWGEFNTQAHPETMGISVKVPCDPTKKYMLIVGRFNGDAASKSVDTNLINSIVLKFYVPKTGNKFKTGDYEFFTVNVNRPLPFNDEETSETTETIEAVLRLPSSYDPYGTPTRLVLACHGASGYIQASTQTWYNANWKTFMDALLDAGYAVFDANIFPTSEGTSIMGQAVGSPLYVNVLKKAYDYIVDNYNVYKEIFAHGTSMGGVGATAFAYAYPNLVLAESSFAGRNFIRYLFRLYTEASDVTDDYAVAYGYTDLAGLASDKYSHCEGCFPDLSLVKYENGVPVLPPDREVNYSAWLAYYSQIADLAQSDDAGVWVGHRRTPYKAWNSWADNVGYTKLHEVLKKAYNKGSACPYYVISYDSGTHTQMSYGQINDMIPQLIAWFKRWE